MIKESVKEVQDRIAKHLQEEVALRYTKEPITINFYWFDKLSAVRAIIKRVDGQPFKDEKGETMRLGSAVIELPSVEVYCKHETENFYYEEANFTACFACGEEVPK